jgi:hypothetical protein
VELDVAMAADRRVAAIDDDIGHGADIIRDA